MKLHPFNECVHHANQIIVCGGVVFQQFTCAHCGAKQTIGEPNTFYLTGSCEECGGLTNIKKDGMNYMVVLQS